MKVQPCGTFNTSLKEPAKGALAHGVSATKKDIPEQEEKLTTYRQGVTCLLAT